MSFRTFTKLNTNRRDVRNDLADRNQMHKRLMSLFPDNLGERPRQAINLIFAANPEEGSLLFQSDLEPDIETFSRYRGDYFTKLVTVPMENVGFLFDHTDSVDFELWFAAQERKTETKKRVNITDDTAVMKVKNVLRKVGLDVKTIKPNDRQQIKASTRGISYENLRLTGTGIVTDAEQLRSAIVRGVGGGRLWGSGVLLIS